MNFRVTLDRKSELSLSEQLYEHIRDLIMSGEFGAGEALPATRELAAQLNISRPTVAASMEQLAKEGYVEIVHGSGTYVRDSLLIQASVKRSKSRGTRNLPLSKFGHQVKNANEKRSKNESQTTALKHHNAISFSFLRPALDQFPVTEWTRALGRTTRVADLDWLDQTPEPEGELVLRKSISHLVQSLRGIVCDPNQIIVFAGLNQALDAIARIHINTGDHVVVEEPGYPYFRSIFALNGAEIHGLPLDEEGLNVAELSRVKFCPKLAYVTPSRQFPTGVTMSVTRRLELLQWAKLNSALIIEDDYDAEYEDSGRPTPALLSLDQSGSVLYAGSLQQLMYPSIGLGYLIVPANLVAAYRELARLLGSQVPPHIQSAVAHFISEGLVEKHIRKLRVHYRERRHAIVLALQTTFGAKVSISADRAGIYVIAKFQSSTQPGKIIERAADLGVEVFSTNSFYSGTSPKNEFILGFGSLSPEEIAEGIRRLGTIIK